MNIAIIINEDKFLFNNDDIISHINPNLNIKIKNLLEIVKNILGEDKIIKLKEENKKNEEKINKIFDNKKNSKINLYFI